MKDVSDKVKQLRKDLVDLAADPIDVGDYRSQMHRYQVLLLGLIDAVIEVTEALELPDEFKVPDA